jgi:uncharacterized membrane protein
MNDSKRDWLSISFLVFMIAMVIGCMAYAWYVYNFYTNFFGNSALSTTNARAEFGQIGDFFGGVLNPFFGFISIIALLLTIFYQARELKLSTDELRNSANALKAQNAAIEHQRFEQTFFSWLANYRELLLSVEDTYSDQFGNNMELIEVKGRKTLDHWYKDDYWSSMVLSKLLDECGLPLDIHFRNNSEKYAALVEFGYSEKIYEKIMGYWNGLYSSKVSSFDSLFRTLYRLILWIDSQSLATLSNAEKWLYASIVRAQLSNIELIYLYFNCLTPRGEKFKRLAEKYALFDNLNSDTASLVDVLRSLQYQRCYLSSTAFDSKAARIAVGLPGNAEETLAMAFVN